MKIETKFDVGDVVYLLSNNKVSFGRIVRVFINVSGSETKIEYRINMNGLVTDELEDNVFDSKESLIESL